MEVMDAAGSGLEDGSGAPTGSTVSGDTGINVGVAIVGAGGSADRGGSGPMTLSSRLSRSSAAKGFERTPSDRACSARWRTSSLTMPDIRITGIIGFCRLSSRPRWMPLPSSRT